LEDQKTSNGNRRMTKLSARQYKMLKNLDQRDSVFIDHARELNQVSFGSLFHRGYIEFNRLTKHFYITKKGSEALQEFKEINITRINVDGAFSHYFPEPKLIRKQKTKNNVQEMRKAS